MNCWHCNKTLVPGPQIFGDVGECFCFTCWCALIELRKCQNELRAQYDRLKEHENEVPAVSEYNFVSGAIEQFYQFAEAVYT